MVSYRVVHQLEPITSLIYISLVHAVAPALEAARATNETACSHRYLPDDGAFFSGGAGYESFRRRSYELAERYDYGASIDIADFYNQIYSHRVRGSIEAASAELTGIAKDLETVIHAINSQASKGIPVGNDASAILAEGILIDVDQLISRSGLDHTRYVDDIRIFADSPQHLLSAIETISEYLYDHHRLHLNSSKTKLLDIENFVSVVMQDHMDAESEAAMNRLNLIDPYGEEELGENDVPDEEVLEEIGQIIRKKYAEDGFVDLNLIKAFVRRCRLLRSCAFVEVAIENIHPFIPAIHELCRAIEAAADQHGPDAVKGLIATIRSSPHYQRKAVKMWLDWTCAGHAEFIRDHSIRDDVFSGNVRTQARAALVSRDLAWVRAQRGTFIHLPPTQRSAVLMSMQLLGQDERRVLLGHIDESNGSPVDVAIKRWLIAR
ncbi:RNA-directed DNA polymerase [Pelagibacterium sp. 26DY04]|uniref:RNA-directed DNA polymerase n=1 Tax=Pelagibacterium sp. 26DY04 TaxID=2967130 RepID=UPI0028156F7B|nr:RNA-directed DNA polymerase [Pelagibacterium sp. 26DY04]WMT87302.1 RNA-directed DNA polymerase [Pelagibacterium sp. 26DY04]